MSAPENNRGSSSKDGHGDPPPLSIELPKIRDLPKKSKPWNNDHLPVDILLLTVEDCEFLACYYYLRNPFKSYHRSLGPVYFGNMGDEEKPLKVALMRSSDPGGCQTVVKNAVTQLRPRAIYSSGFCSGVNQEETKLGDVVVSSKLTTDAYNMRSVADGWEPPLENPEAQEVKVHFDGEILSCPGALQAEQQRMLYPKAIAVEMDGKGIFPEAHDITMKWVIVKGVSSFADGSISTNESWKTFACCMAASLISNMLDDSVIFEDWPHYGDISAGEESSNSHSKRKLPCSSDHPDAKRTRLADIHVDAFKKDKPSDRELDELAGKIAAKWKTLGIHLGICQDVLEEIATNANDKPSQMLLRWRNTATSATPYRDLYYALCHDRIGLNNVAKEFCYASTEEESSHSCSKRELSCSSDHPDAKQSGIAAQTDEQDVKGMHKEQELDQYEDHDAWLKLVKQDYGSFLALFYSEEQTDQQRKRINLFVARFPHEFLAMAHVCSGCRVKLSDRRYRCLNCLDVDFCYDCYMKRVKPEGHTENHEVIEMRFKCGDCKGFILGTRFCCYECPDFFLCFQCQSRHPAAHKVTKFPVKKEPFVEECQKQLHSHYNTFSKVKIIPWERSSAIHIDEIYTTLSWVRDDRKPSGVTQEKLEDYTDIFKGDMHHPKPKRLLVYGRPGIGKSTFSQKTAFDWSNQRKGLLMRFDLVLLIKLRNVCNLKDIRDVLRASKMLAGDVDDAYDYILRNQEKVLLILDGYDEYTCSGAQSPVRDIWEGTQLINCHVILTTRHEKADELKFSSHVQYQINGFESDDQVRAFASKFLRDEEQVEEFVSYLNERRLKDMAEIPLCLLMLCTVWKENHLRELPKSRAYICQDFVQTLFHHTIAKDAKAKQLENIDAYKEELCTLGKLAFDALLQGFLSFDKLPDSILSEKLIKVGLFHVVIVSRFFEREQRVEFIHKSVQEYLAAFYLKEELLKEESTTCLSEVDSFEKIVKMIEVLKFACELSAEATCVVLSHLGIVGKKEGLTEYNFTETPCIRDLSDGQRQFLTLISQCFLSCSAEKRRDLYPMFLSYVGGVLLINSDQLHRVANEHLLKSAAASEFIFFSSGKHSEQSYRDLITVVEDLGAVVVSCSGEKKASDFLKKYTLQSVGHIFLKKEEGKIYLYIAGIHNLYSTFPTEMLRELISLPESTQKKKPVGDQSNEQDNSSALCLTENAGSTPDTRATQRCLSCVWRISVSYMGRQEMETLIEVLPFVTSPRRIDIYGRRTTDPVLVDTLVSRINFTNRLDRLALQYINLTAKPAAFIARSLYQAPNLRLLDLSFNPLGEGVSDLTRHLSCAPSLESLSLLDVKMTKKQVNDLTEAVRQSKISGLWSSYHDLRGNPRPEHEWPSEDY